MDIKRLFLDSEFLRLFNEFQCVSHSLSRSKIPVNIVVEEKVEMPGETPVYRTTWTLSDH